MKTAKTDGRAYAGFGGRVFRVARAGRTRLWWAVGRGGRGVREMFLDKLGPRPRREEMQEALDGMAVRLGWKAVEA